MDLAVEPARRPSVAFAEGETEQDSSNSAEGIDDEEMGLGGAAPLMTFFSLSNLSPVPKL
jgi:hypothetical protein